MTDQRVFIPLSLSPPAAVDLERPELHPTPDLSVWELRLRRLLIDVSAMGNYVFDPESTDITFITEEVAEIIQSVQAGLPPDPTVMRELCDLLGLEPVDGVESADGEWGIKLHLNHNCNLACEYCYADGRTSDLGGTTTGAYGGPVSYMSRETMLGALVPFMRDAPGDDVTVIFFGGEPLLSAQRFFEAVELTNEVADTYSKKVQFSMTTNATLLTEPILECLKINGFRVAAKPTIVNAQPARAPGHMMPSFTGSNSLPNTRSLPACA
jgi:sulfatase maturation enzyme AslB (radical SAM superfamily)